jgi:hypothetical protein
VLSDGVAGENCIVYIMVQLMYLQHGKNTTLQTLQIQSVRRSAHKVVSTEILTLDMEDKTLVSSDMKRVQDFSRTKVSMIS